MASWIKPVLISTGVVAVAMQLKIIVPVVALDFSRAPILFGSFLSWLKPPYLYVITNVIIAMIGFSSIYHRIITNPEVKDHGGSYGGDHKFQNEQNVHRAQPQRSEDFSFIAVTPPSKTIVKEIERPEVFTEKLAEAAAKVEEEKKCLVVVAKPENQTPVEKPLVSARIGQRKLVKTTTAERKSLKALRVAKPKRQETLESTWKMITEGKPLTSYYRRPDTFGLGVEDSNKTKQSGLKKAETFSDRTKYYLSPAVSRSRNELNIRAEAFIKKCNDERFESMRHDTEMTRRGLSF
ncbi:hypothetical protein Rs2_01016 [Raphanus sativus]|uniref:Uncharacterized protein LOC108856817 n=1 Tax=Raphanus sativus TaxID=3726 RepID=A0A6J0NQ21_RAPSA|nr:uncharacterized protein LOC108856817 [Raphanus sativus]KAJ4915466.1 hypothetical protein Rs2_01016 [Raphanus sativus]